VARIAIVDDNASARLFASACLKQDGHEVLELEPTCLYEVLKTLHEEEVDLLITDLVMPDCPGLTLLRACREDHHLRELKILLLTCFGDASLARFIQSRGNIHYMGKPVAPQELCESVRLYLDGDLEVDPGWSLECQGHVAVVDDSHLSRKLHMSILRRTGFKPLEIVPESLTHVLTTLKEAKPDILLLDFLMPSFCGDALIRAIRATEAIGKMPIILVTAHGSSEAMAPLQRDSRLDIIRKPVLPADLVQRMKEMIRMASEADGH